MRYLLPLLFLFSLVSTVQAQDSKWVAAEDEYGNQWFVLNDAPLTFSQYAKGQAAFTTVEELFVDGLEGDEAIFAFNAGFLYSNEMFAIILQTRATEGFQIQQIVPLEEGYAMFVTTPLYDVVYLYHNQEMMLLKCYTGSALDTLQLMIEAIK